MSRVERVFVHRDRLRQQLSDDALDGVELLEPHQVQRIRARRWHVATADAQRSVHALRRPRLPGGLSRRWRDRAIYEWHRRLSAAELYRLRILRERLSLRYSQVQSDHQEDVQVHALRRPRERGARARLHQILSHRLPALRQQRRHEGSRRDSRPATARALQLREGRGVRSGGRDLRAARYYQSRSLWRIAERSSYSVGSPLLERSGEVDRKSRDAWRSSG